MSGTAGCNNYSASYTVDGNAITIGPAISTMMFCADPEGVMEQEMAYLQALPSAATYVVQGDRLVCSPPTVRSSRSMLPDHRGRRHVRRSRRPAQAELANLAYTGTSVFTGTVQLANGVYTETVAPDSAMVTSIQLTDFVTVGELNGEPAIAAILNSSGGGSGVFFDLAVATQEDGQWTNVATTFLGDRVTINSLAIANNQVIVDMVTQGPNGPMCSATLQVVNSYEVQGNQLIQVSSRRSAMSAQPAWRPRPPKAASSESCGNGSRTPAATTRRRQCLIRASTLWRCTPMARSISRSNTTGAAAPTRLTAANLLST